MKKFLLFLVFFILFSAIGYADTNLIPYNQNGYDYVMNQSSSYILYIKSHSSWGDGVKYCVDDSGIEKCLIYQSSDYSYRDKWGSQDYISSITDVVGTVNGSKITYNNSYVNVSLEYQTFNDMLKENYIIYKLPKVPATYLTAPITLDFGGYIKYGNLSLFVNNTNVTGVDFVTNQTIQFRNGNKTLFYLPMPYAIDSKGNITILQYEVKNQGGQFWFYVRTPFLWLNNTNRIYPVYIDPTIVGSTITNTPTAYSFQRKTFWANGRFWVFYDGGGGAYVDIAYKTSTNGITWSGATEICHDCANTGYYFSVWFDGTYVHYVRRLGPNYYRRGIPNSDGTITWSDIEQTVNVQFTTSTHAPFVSTDSNGYPWIGYNDYNQGSGIAYPVVVKSNLSNGTWQTATGFPYILNTTFTGDSDVSLIPLTNGRMLAIYGMSGQTLRMKSWNSTNWGTEVATTNTITYYSAVAQGDDVHIVFMSGSTVYYTFYNYTSNSLSSESVYGSATATSAPVLSIDTNNNLYSFWAGSNTYPNYIYYRKYNGTNWEDAVSWLTSEVLTSNDLLTSFYKDYGNKIGLAFSSGTSSPYNVKFDFLVLKTPKWYSNQSYTPTSYNPNVLSQFNITWNTTVEDISKMFLEINLSSGAVNYTITNSTFGGSIYNLSVVLPAGTYYWKSYANDTYNNWNSTPSWTFTINKNTSQFLKLINNISWSGVYPNSTNTTGYGCLSGFTCYLYRNSTLIGSTDPISDNVLLGAGVYNYTYNFSGSQNYTWYYNTSLLTINQNTSNPIQLNMSKDNWITNITNGNISVLTTDNVSIYGWLDYTDGGLVSLFIDGTSQSNSYSNTFGVGIHSIQVNTSGNSNYTSNDTGLTFYIIVSNPLSTAGGGGSPTPKYVPNASFEIDPIQIQLYTKPNSKMTILPLIPPKSYTFSVINNDTRVIKLKIEATGDYKNWFSVDSILSENGMELQMPFDITQGEVVYIRMKVSVPSNAEIKWYDIPVSFTDVNTNTVKSAEILLNVYTEATDLPHYVFFKLFYPVLSLVSLPSNSSSVSYSVFSIGNLTNVSLNGLFSWTGDTLRINIPNIKQSVEIPFVLKIMGFFVVIGILSLVLSPIKKKFKHKLVIEVIIATISVLSLFLW